VIYNTSVRTQPWKKIPVLPVAVWPKRRDGGILFVLFFKNFIL